MSISLLQAFSPATHTASATTTASPTASASSSSSSSSNPGLDLTNTFLQLLTVQLQNQSPLNPLDPNAFVTQLAQFDSLGELTQIQQLMQTLVNDVNSGAPPSVAAGSAKANSNSTSISGANSIAR